MAQTDCIPNYVLVAKADPFEAVWKLTRLLKSLGWTWRAGSDGVTKHRLNQLETDNWGSSVTPKTVDAYPALSSGAWWCGRGPTTWVVPIGANDLIDPTKPFIRGELMVQTNSGATAEVLGVVVDTAGSAGYVVLALKPASAALTNGAPDTLVGQLSGASIAPNAFGAIRQFVREVVIWKNGGTGASTNGHVYYQCCEVGVGTTFTSLADDVGCTPTICPGGASAVGNAFPGVSSGAYVVLGQAGTDAVATNPSNWWGNWNVAAANLGVVHILATNAVGDSILNGSPDGSFLLMWGWPITNGGCYTAWGFQRCDDQEDGDIEPYAWFSPSYANTDATNRLARYDVLNATEPGYPTGPDGLRLAVTAGISFLDNISQNWRSWYRRGLSGEEFQEMWPATLAVVPNNRFEGAAVPLMRQTLSSPESIATAPVRTMLREPIWIVTNQAAHPTKKQRKGTVRWMFAKQGGVGGNLFDGKMWVQGSNFSTNTVVGPWDGSSNCSNG